ncbi:hypothetical protein [Antrihabitans sp. YC2-6]|uniref:hypothetical protein n=1 Tax=Antrihabitans sp. YC2-6 TaxID=2799498 RepID=UPI0018F40A78|nr:hypothetical protein [Antrihabitans sp. YC2-6]MBJ8347401.1 hypothetical protein [Antrihabitans sp. YC2-6]
MELISPAEQARWVTSRPLQSTAAGERRADGLALLLDSYLGSGAGPGEGGVKPHLVVTVPGFHRRTTRVAA